MKLATNIHPVNGNCLKVFMVRDQSSRSCPDQLMHNGGGIHFNGVALKLQWQVVVLTFSCVYADYL